MQAKFAALRLAPRELRLVYVLKLLESFADFSTALNFVLYLTNDFGLSDLEAGTYYGAWGVVTSIYGMMLGPAIDRLGVRWSLVAGGSLLTFGRALMAIATTRAQVIVAAFMVQPMGMALAIPVLSIAIRRTTNDANRSTAYGVFYAVMNVGALLSGLGTDAFNAYLRERYGTSGAMRALFWTGTATSLLYTVVAYALFRDTPPQRLAAEQEHVDAEMASGHTKTTWQVVRETWVDSVFWRLVVFTAFLFGARSIFRHMDTTIPKWMQRTIGKDARYGDVYSINPAIVIATVAPVQAYLADADPYRVVVIGTSVTAAAPLALFFFAPSYASATLFMVILSAGEVYYSSKTMEFSMLLAPEGREGVYGTLASAPLFVVRLLSGATSGGLLAHFCPADPPRHCSTMWLVISAIAWTSPFLLVAARRWLYNDDVRRRIEDARSRTRAIEIESLIADDAPVEATYGIGAPLVAATVDEIIEMRPPKHFSRMS